MQSDLELGPDRDVEASLLVLQAKLDRAPSARPTYEEREMRRARGMHLPRSQLHPVAAAKVTQMKIHTSTFGMKEYYGSWDIKCHMHCCDDYGAIS